MSHYDCGFLLFLLVVVSVFVLHVSRPGYLVHLYFKLLHCVLSSHPHLGLVHFSVPHPFLSVVGSTSYHQAPLFSLYFFPLSHVMLYFMFSI